MRLLKRISKETSSQEQNFDYTEALMRAAGFDPRTATKGIYSDIATPCMTPDYLRLIVALETGVPPELKEPEANHEQRP